MEASPEVRDKTKTQDKNKKGNKEKTEDKNIILFLPFAVHYGLNIPDIKQECEERKCEVYEQCLVKNVFHMCSLDPSDRGHP